MQANRLMKIALLLLLGTMLWHSPHPAGLTDAGWHSIAIFFTVIVSIIVKPMPIGAITVIAASIGLVTGAFTNEQVFSSFSSQVVWLVVLALFIAKGFGVTGLGERLGLIFTRMFGKKTIGIAYGLAATDLVMSPAVPSVTGRSAGIIYPILRSIAEEFSSFPNTDSSKRVGAYLTITAYHVTCITSSMFLTAMAANPMIVQLLDGQGVELTWAKWALGGIVPGLIALAIIPFVLYKIFKPELTDTPQAPAMARDRLAAMGPMSAKEWLMAAVVGLLLFLWIFGKSFGIGAAAAALIGLSILVISGVLSWDDLTREHSAWEIFVWFALLIMMAANLTQTGVITWFSDVAGAYFQTLPWEIAFPLIAATYFLSHYFFASATAHVASMFMPMLLIAFAVGTPKWLAIMTLTYFSNLYGLLTHYGLSPAPILFGVGYVDVKDWWRLGLVSSIICITIYGVIGSAWWHLLGWW